MASNRHAILAASAARTANGAGDAVQLANKLKALVFLLDMTIPATDAGDKIDILIQDSIDGDTWNDLIAFVQVLGNAAASKQMAIVNCEVAPSTALAAPTDGTMADGVRAGPVCSLIRAKWIVTKDADSPEDQSFTFSIGMQSIR